MDHHLLRQQKGQLPKIEKDGRVFEGGKELGSVTYLSKNRAYQTMTV